MENGDAVAEARVELAGDGGREGDLRHQHEGAASGGQRGVDSVEVDLGLAGAGDAVQQECTESVRGDAGVDEIERVALRDVELVRGADGNIADCQGLRGQRDGLFARERPRGLAGVVDQRFKIGEIVGAGMERETGEKFALGFGNFSRGFGAGERDAEFG